MSTEKNTSLAITFIAPSELDDVDDAITLELDSDANEDETTFASGKPAYVRQFPPGEYSTVVNVGTVKKRLRRVSYTVEKEKVYFQNSETANLTYLPEGGVSYAWIGTDFGEPVFNGRVITAHSVIVGVLECTYVTLYDQLMVMYSGIEDTTVLLAVMNEATEDQDFLRISYEGVESATTRPVIITVKNYCSNEVVENASIALSAIGYPTTYFITDAEGKADLGNLTVGVTYNIKITAVGYRDSDVDSLSNESFTVIAVPEEDEEE